MGEGTPRVWKYDAHLVPLTREVLLGIRLYQLFALLGETYHHIFVFIGILTLVDDIAQARLIRHEVLHDELHVLIVVQTVCKQGVAVLVVHAPAQLFEHCLPHPAVVKVGVCLTQQRVQTPLGHV